MVFARFGYSESSEVHLSLEANARPQHTLNAALATHIAHHDGPNKLIIVYYAGYGRLDGENKLELIP